LCGNKVDVKNREVKPKNITFHRKKSIQYYEISVKSNYNYEKPFVHLLRKLAKDPQLALVQPPALYPPEILIDKEQALLAENELEQASKMPLPDEGDDIDEFS